MEYGPTSSRTHRESRLMRSAPSAGSGAGAATSVSTASARKSEPIGSYGVAAGAYRLPPLVAALPGDRSVIAAPDGRRARPSKPATARVPAYGGGPTAR